MWTRRLHRFAVVSGCFLSTGVAACALVANLGDRTLGDISGEGGSSSGNVEKDSSGPDGAPGPVTGFGFHRTVTITSDAPAALADYPVLIVVPSTFDYSSAKSGGDDVRFSTTATHTDDLQFFIEQWNPGGESIVWVHVKSVPVGTSTIHMFYGKAGDNAVSSFESVFPNSRRSAGADAGSFTANGDIDTGWFELKAGDTMTIEPGIPVKITARRIIVAGSIVGIGCGEAGGLLPNGKGGGTGGGTSSPTMLEGAGGAGHGGAGGNGGADDGGSPGLGGIANGVVDDDTLEMGSGGGSSEDHVGGAGGGAITLLGWKTTVTGVIHMDGVDGQGGLVAGNAGNNDDAGSGHQGGGGAGGGVLIGGAFVDLGASTISANGGAGGACFFITNDCGGGGGGGRVKLRSRQNGALVQPASATEAFGAGGAGGTGTGSAAPGSPGFLGTTNITDKSTLVTGAETTLSPPQAAP